MGAGDWLFTLPGEPSPAPHPGSFRSWVVAAAWRRPSTPGCGEPGRWATAAWQLIQASGLAEWERWTLRTGLWPQALEPRRTFWPAPGYLGPGPPALSLRLWETDFIIQSVSSWLVLQERSFAPQTFIDPDTNKK